MARFEGAKKVEKSQEKRLGFSLADKFKAAGFEVSKPDVQAEEKKDEARLAEVREELESTPDLSATSHVEEVKAEEDIPELESVMEPVPESGVRKLELENMETSEVDTGWGDVEMKGLKTEQVKEAEDEAHESSVEPRNISEERKTLRGGFVPRVIEGGRGKTELMETGVTGTLVEPEEQVRAKQEYQTPELLKEVSYPSFAEAKITVGEDYLSPEEEKEYLGIEESHDVESDVHKKVEIGNIEEPEGLSLREAAEEVAKENEISDELKNENEPLSLREQFEVEQNAETPAPAITPEVMDPRSVEEMMQEEAEKEEAEERVMILLNRLGGGTSVTQEDIDELVSRADPLIAVYKEQYGEEEGGELEQKFIQGLNTAIDKAHERRDNLPKLIEELDEAVDLREAQEGGDVGPEAVIALAGAAAAAAAVEKTQKTVEMSAEEKLKSEIGSLAKGQWHESFAKGEFGGSHWLLLSPEEKGRFLELQKDIVDQEERLAHVKEAKNATERAMRAKYGNQFEVSVRAQKYMREKAGEIAKIEALLGRNKREQEMLRQKAIERMQPDKTVSPFDAPRPIESSFSDRIQSEIEPKSSWWKKHSKLRVAAIGGGVVAGAGLFAGVWVGYKALKMFMRPMKALELLGNATEGFFNFLDKALVKGDPLGAVTDSAKSAEKFFGEKFKRLEDKINKKDKQKKKDKGIKYAST